MSSLKYHTSDKVPKTIVGSSAPIERVFSQTDLLVSPRRTSINEEVCRIRLFLRVNQNFV